MAKSTTDQLQMFYPETLQASARSTSSPDVAAGPLPSSLLGFLPTSTSGLDPARVSLSARRDGAKVPTILGICGPTSFASSTPAGPLASWENRLRERLAMVGSTESPLIWEARVSPAGQSISRLRPWTPRRSGSGSGGLRSTWPAPMAAEPDADPLLRDQRRLVAKQRHKGKTGNGLGFSTSELMRRAPDQLAPWPAVQASAASAGHTSRSGDRKDELLLQGMMRENSPVSPWAPPMARDKAGANSAAHTARQKAKGHGLTQLNDQMYQTSARPRAAPRAGDWRSGSSLVGANSLRPGGSMLPEQMTETQAPTSPEGPGGPAPTGSCATTRNRGGSPTPAHPCWLQGFPAVWLLGAAWATQSASRSPSKSSAPRSKRSSRRRP